MAHPHIFAEARLDVVVNEENEITTLRHVWRFDELFSSTVIMEFDKNRDLKLDETELKEVSLTIHSSLAEYDYFQFLTVNGKDIKIRPPPELNTYFEGQQLIVLFESTPENTLKLTGKISIGVYDPTFYTAIDFAEDSYMNVEGLPSSCTRTVVRPDPDEAIAQNQDTLTEAFFSDPTDLTKIFATRLEIDCPP